MLRRSSRQLRLLDCYVPSLDYVMLIDYVDKLQKEPICYEEAMLRDNKPKCEMYAIRNGLAVQEFHMGISSFSNW